ncbi:MAG: choice-of-anchor D domain-containing protein [Agriterribacter sp.]
MKKLLLSTLSLIISLTLLAQGTITKTYPNGERCPGFDFTYSAADNVTSGGMTWYSYNSVEFDFKVRFVPSANRWEIQFSNGRTEAYNINATGPKPPATGWIDALNNCGNPVFTGDVASLALSPSMLPDAVLGTAYSQTISATGGTAPYTYTLSSGTLPLGLTLGSNGVLSGTPSAIGTYSFTITASDASSETYPYKGLKDYTVRVLGLPEISVQGNGMTIADGDATPSTADFTDFGSQSVTSGSITKTYTIQNTGTDTLFVFSVTISGMAGRDYSTSFITPDTILAGGSSSLQVLFDPSVAGARNATVTINSNDADEAVYDFAITGKGIAADVNGVLYVKQGATGGGDSWNNALGSFGEALDAARNSTAIQQIWVAKGTYQPASGQSFSLVKGVDIYGHFAGTETALSQRNLSGTDTSFLKGNGSRVMYNNNNGLTPADRLDGFTITGGANVALGAAHLQLKRLSIHYQLLFYR